MHHHQTMYRCTGSCGGVSPEAKNCGAESCEMHDQPLQAVMQCDHCADSSAKDMQAHACSMCQPV